MKLLLVSYVLLVTFVNGGMDLTNYKLTWDQDFTTMKQLNVTAYGPGSTWIAHTPYGGDWVNFMNPSGPYMPFNVGNGVLTIRAQKSDGKYFGGLLSSVDQQGKGFTQKYGYFEMSAKLPPGPATWPAFWLLDVESVINKSPTWNSEEIDILEQYGSSIGLLHTTLHYWVRSNSSKSWGVGTQYNQCGMTTGFHTYGLDIQSDLLTFYYDRLLIWQMPNNVPGFTDSFNRELYVLVNLAPCCDTGYLDNNYEDMEVQYVKVWQGSGGSAKANDTSQSDAVTFQTAGLTLLPGQQVNIKNINLVFTKDGDLEITNTQGTILWQTNTTSPMCTKCSAVFQNDGNLVINGPSKVVWASNTWNNNVGSMLFSNQSPYLQIMNGDCKVLWSTVKMQETIV